MSGPKKIVLVGNFLPDRQESMLRFERALAEGFTGCGLPVETVRPKPRFVTCGPRYRYGGMPKYLGYLDKFALFPRHLRRFARGQPRDTVFHIVDHSNAVYAPHLRDVPLLVTVHDLLQIRSARGEFPLNRLSRSGAKYQEWILRNLTQLRAAACISQKTRADLQRLTGLADTAIAVLPNSLNYSYSPLPAAEAMPLIVRGLTRHGLSWPRTTVPGAPSPSFLFSIGGAQWYKNRTGLVAIFAALRRLPGQQNRALFYVGPAFDSEQQAIIDKHHLQDAILRIPGLDNEELRAAYSLADGLLFPSWEEGFGWPIAEAQACGCPVFTSNRPPMTEVGGDAARYIDPADPTASAALIAETLTDSASLRAAGLERAKRWAPQAMLDAYLHLYTLLLENRHREPFPAAA